MNTYLIIWGADNSLSTWQAGSPDEAVEEFCEEMFDDYGNQVTIDAIEQVMLATPTDWKSA